MNKYTIIACLLISLTTQTFAAFCEGDPVNKVDPLGLAPTTVERAVSPSGTPGVPNASYEGDVDAGYKEYNCPYRYFDHPGSWMKASLPMREKVAAIELLAMYTIPIMLEYAPQAMPLCRKAGVLTVRTRGGRSLLGGISGASTAYVKSHRNGPVPEDVLRQTMAGAVGGAALGAMLPAPSASEAGRMFVTLFGGGGGSYAGQASVNWLLYAEGRLGAPDILTDIDASQVAISTVAAPLITMGSAPLWRIVGPPAHPAAPGLYQGVHAGLLGLFAADVEMGVEYLLEDTKRTQGEQTPSEVR